MLIARGLSNRAIAEELVISPATAARHVANILGKLGLNSRAQVAAWTADSAGQPDLAAETRRQLRALQPPVAHGGPSQCLAAAPSVGA